MRKKIVAGNWKMNLVRSEAKALVEGLKQGVGSISGVDIVLCPPFTSLQTVGELLGGTQIDLGAQNMSWEKSGAYTGEVSAAMLRDVGCRYVILGHSERRAYFKETDADVNRKARFALENSLHPIVCVGETLDERESGRMQAVVESQVRGSLAGFSAKDFLESVIAYEPVWAIGTGKTASPEQAQEVHALIRGVVASMVDQTVADSVRIQYGGSVKGSNARELFGQPDIDGGLIGGAALDAASFIEIIRAGV